MFVGAINRTVREFIGNNARAFDARTVVVGCSGNFTSEAVLTQCARPQTLHSNDVSFYSCMLGNWLTSQPVAYRIVDPAFAWLDEHLLTEDAAHRCAAIMVLLDALAYRKQANAHQARMWQLYRENFAELVEKTVERLTQVNIHIDTFYAGDVFDHFQRFADEPDAVFCCYAPTYAGGYEKLYKALDKIVAWDAPPYEMLTQERRNRLLAWLRARAFVWYDDRLIDGLTPVMQQQAGNHRTVYIYSNVVTRPAVFRGIAPPPLPKLPLADSKLVIRPDSQITLWPITTTDMVAYKNVYLAKHILFASGKWPFAVLVDGVAVGFLEFALNKYRVDGIYAMADFAVAGTRYDRLSKLIVMLMVAGETRRCIERVAMTRLRVIATTAFTDRPVSMKYRGVLKLVKRGESAGGQKFLQYESAFNDKTWRETMTEWLTKHGLQQ